MTELELLEQLTRTLADLNAAIAHVFSNPPVDEEAEVVND